MTLPRRYPDREPNADKKAHRAVRRAREAAGQRPRRVFRATFGGLALRVTEKGHKSWSLYYRLGGRLRRYTIGLYPAIKPAQARREAGAALERARQGVDLTAEKRRRRDEVPPEADTFAAALHDYLERARRNMAASTFAECKRTLEREFKPWRNRPIASLTRGDVNRVIDRIVARGSEIQANRAFAYFRRFFNWSVERGRLPASPVAGMRPPSKESARDRVLNDDEIRWLWQACDTVDWPFGTLARMLLLTAQRRDEVATMERRELDLKKHTC